MTNKEVFAIWEKTKPCWIALGLRYENPRKAVRYFCTPQKARIFASLGVDGIHYCTIPHFGNTVFVVNPSASEGRYVMPVAESAAMFFSLIRTLHGTQLIDQMVSWDKETFRDAWENLRSESDPAREQEWQSMCAAFPVPDMEDPYGYVHALCAAFDPADVPYTEEYYETLGLTPRKSKEYDFVSTMVIYREK